MASVNAIPMDSRDIDPISSYLLRTHGMCPPPSSLGSHVVFDSRKKKVASLPDFLAFS